MKIIRVNNFDDPTVSDELIAENVGKIYGEAITNFLNFHARAYDEWFKLVDDNRKLYDAGKELYGE